jgi:hypothetical protein
VDEKFQPFELSYNDGKKIYVEEPGIWSLICRCTKPIADEFNDQLHLMLMMNG